MTLAPCAPCYASQYLLFGLDTGSVRGSALPLPLPLSISTSADSCRIKTISISLHSRDQRASHSSKCTENLTEKPGRRGKKCLIMYEDQLGADPPEVNEMSGHCTAFALGRSADNSRIIWRRESIQSLVFQILDRQGETKLAPITAICQLAQPTTFGGLPSRAYLCVIFASHGTRMPYVNEDMELRRSAQSATTRTKYTYTLP